MIISIYTTKKHQRVTSLQKHATANLFAMSIKPSVWAELLYFIVLSGGSYISLYIRGNYTLITGKLYIHTSEILQNKTLYLENTSIAQIWELKQ